MALVRCSFGEYYNELVRRQPSDEELFKQLFRDEKGFRRKIEAKCALELSDMLHLVGVMIGDKKKREKGAFGRMDKYALELFERQRAVWFPAAHPRAVAPPTRAAGRGFPHTEFSKLKSEEEELRHWLWGIEGRLRDGLERACSNSWFILNCFSVMYEHELRGRQRLEKEEHELFTEMRRKVFLLAPAEYFKKIVVDRYGSTYREPSPPHELTFEEVEEFKRDELVRAEHAGRVTVFRWLYDIYNASLFMANHQEIVQRAEIVEQRDCELYPIAENLCRNTFGLLFYNVPSVILHCSSRATAMTQLCVHHIEEMQKRAERIKELVHNPPPTPEPVVPIVKATPEVAADNNAADDVDAAVEEPSELKEPAGEDDTARESQEAPFELAEAAATGEKQINSVSEASTAAEADKGARKRGSRRSVCFVEHEEKDESTELMHDPENTNVTSSASAAIARAKASKAFEGEDTEEEYNY